MEIESFWNGLPGFKKYEKGIQGINYGCWKKRGREVSVLTHVHNHRRKAYRQIRKRGFDDSELWSLDLTIMRWLSDNVGDIFKKTGYCNDWTDYDLEGNEYDFWEHRSDKDWGEKNSLYDNTRTESYKKHLKDFIENPPSKEIYESFVKFVVPRLRRLSKMLVGWPQGEDFPTFEDWIKEINNMANKFEEGTYSPYFISYFFNLWD